MLRKFCEFSFDLLFLFLREAWHYVVLLFDGFQRRFRLGSVLTVTPRGRFLITVQPDVQQRQWDLVDANLPDPLDLIVQELEAGSSIAPSGGVPLVVTLLHVAGTFPAI